MGGGTGGGGGATDLLAKVNGSETELGLGAADPSSALILPVS